MFRIPFENKIYQNRFADDQSVKFSLKCCLSAQHNEFSLDTVSAPHKPPPTCIAQPQLVLIEAYTQIFPINNSLIQSPYDDARRSLI